LSIKQLEEDILKVWGRHTEFSAKGNRYVAFVLQKQIDEIREAEFTDVVMDKELADMALVILRHYARQGKSSEEMIRLRLNKRHEGKTDQIKDKYLAMYENYKFPEY
jgi:predicted house-cleaning noncanonical NTP pyrophosphatase (MazG superfamily)